MRNPVSHGQVLVVRACVQMLYASQIPATPYSLILLRVLSDSLSDLLWGVVKSFLRLGFSRNDQRLLNDAHWCRRKMPVDGVVASDSPTAMLVCNWLGLLKEILKSYRRRQVWLHMKRQ